jgi:hypothetical protein
VLSSTCVRAKSDRTAHLICAYSASSYITNPTAQHQSSFADYPFGLIDTRRWLEVVMESVLTQPITQEYPWHAADLARHPPSRSPFSATDGVTPKHLTPLPHHTDLYVPCLLDTRLAVQLYPSLSAASLELCISVVSARADHPSHNKEPQSPAASAC